MIDAGIFKQTLKDATDEEAKALYGWATVCMEVRGLIPLAGAKRQRSDAGKPRTAKPADQLELREPGQ